MWLLLEQSGKTIFGIPVGRLRKYLSRRDMERMDAAAKKSDKVETGYYSVLLARTPDAKSDSPHVQDHSIAIK